MKQLEQIDKMIQSGLIDNAIEVLHSFISEKQDDQAYYLLGNAYRKKGDFKNAMENYLEAIAINPDSPAVEAQQMLINILEFYHKDLYNP